jgi:hypothetical protein
MVVLRKLICAMASPHIGNRSPALPPPARRRPPGARRTPQTLKIAAAWPWTDEIVTAWQRVHAIPHPI